MILLSKSPSISGYFDSGNLLLFPVTSMPEALKEMAII